MFVTCTVGWLGTKAQTLLRTLPLFGPHKRPWVLSWRKLKVARDGPEFGFDALGVLLFVTVTYRLQAGILTANTPGDLFATCGDR